MTTVAEQLHQARENRKLTIEQVADITKIRTDHLRALEEGNFDVFSAPVYIRGFIRSYATLLKLDVPQVMTTLDGELAQTRKFSEPPSLSGEPRGVLDYLMLQLSKINWQRSAVGLILVLILAAAVGYGLWRHSRKTDPLRNLHPGVYQTAPGASGETLPLPAPAPNSTQRR